MTGFEFVFPLFQDRDWGHECQEIKGVFALSDGVARQHYPVC